MSPEGARALIRFAHVHMDYPRTGAALHDASFTVARGEFVFLTGAPTATIGNKVARLLTQVGLASKATSLPHELSGGEQQRVAIARALVNDPIVLLADEPTGNLDDRATRGVFQLLRDINTAGTAVVMATHDLELIKRAECRTIEVNRGKIVFDSAAGASPPGVV